MINSASTVARQAVRRFTTSVVRRSGHHDPYDGVAGYNFPFSVKNRHALFAKMLLCWGSGAVLPYLLVRHHLLK